MASAPVKLVLASASPRRLALLERIGLTPDLLNPADIDETSHKRETPRAFSVRLATEKARAAERTPAHLCDGSLRSAQRQVQPVRVPWPQPNRPLLRPQ